MRSDLQGDICKLRSACRKSLFAPRGAGIHRRPSRFPCALRPEIGGATGRKNLFFPLPLLSELVKVLIIFDFNGAGNPSWVSRAHLSFPLRKSLLAAHRPFPLLGLSPHQEPPCGGCAPKRACGRSPAHTLHPQGVCSIRKAAQPLTAALPYRPGEFTTLLTVSDSIFLPILRQENRYFNSFSAKPPEILRSGILSVRTRLSSC